jgi:mannose-1-phosphate guanylyltransferase
MNDLNGCLAAIDTVILAGGKGTRIRSVVSDRPKILAPVAGRPVLEWMLDWLKRYGARRIVLSLGYMAEMVEDYLDQRPLDGLKIITKVEPEPLGTGGGLRYAGNICSSDPVLVINGDTLVDGDLCAALDQYQIQYQSGGAPVLIVCAHVDDGRRYGRVKIENSSIQSFHEKDETWDKSADVSAGVYLFSRDVILAIPQHQTLSLETDILAAFGPGTIGAYSKAVTFLDIGTPSSFSMAHKALESGAFQAKSIKDWENKR